LHAKIGYQSLQNASFREFDLGVRSHTEDHHLLLCLHTHTHTYIYRHTYASVYANTYAYVHVYIYFTFVCIHTHTHTHGKTRNSRQPIKESAVISIYLITLCLSVCLSVYLPACVCVSVRCLSCLSRENTFSSKRTHSTVREHIL